MKENIINQSINQSFWQDQAIFYQKHTSKNSICKHLYALKCGLSVCTLPCAQMG